MSQPIKALVPYYGCKRQMADRIVGVLGDHQAYWEPFAGSCAVALAKPPARQEVLNDLHGGLVNLLTVVRDDDLAPALFDRMYRTAFCEKLYKESIAESTRFFMEDWHPTKRNLDWAYHYLVSSWMGRNGLAGTEKEHRTGFCKRFTSNGGDPAKRWRSVVDSVPWWWERLRNVTVLNEDGLKLLDRIEDKEGTVVYCDPPYVRKDARYLHDFERAQHEALAASLRRFTKTRVVVSYYEDPLVDGLYTGWEKVPVSVPKNLAVAGGPQPAPEILLVNRPEAP